VNRPRTFASSSIVALALSTLAGCSSGGDDPPPPPPNQPPHVAEVVIPAWPPPGPNGTITVRATDDVGLESVTASFRGRTQELVSGPRAEVTFRAAELGEGLGDLVVRACDTRLVCVDRTVTRFLVDLTPPELETDRVVASPRREGVDGEIAVWVADAWILGSVELTFAGKRFVHEFPHAYPDTLGKAWDVSRVAFPASELPEGAGDATVVVRDAAGNVTTRKVSVRIDGTPPTARVLEPADGAKVEGPLRVRVAGADPGATRPVSLDVWVGGALVGTFAGPEAAVTVDTDGLPRGPVSVKVVATDEAGNPSEVARSTVVLR